MSKVIEEIPCNIRFRFHKYQLNIKLTQQHLLN